MKMIDFGVLIPLKNMDIFCEWLIFMHYNLRTLSKYISICRIQLGTKNITQTIVNIFCWHCIWSVYQCLSVTYTGRFEKLLSWCLGLSLGFRWIILVTYILEPKNWTLSLNFFSLEAIKNQFLFVHSIIHFWKTETFLSGTESNTKQLKVRTVSEGNKTAV